MFALGSIWKSISRTKSQIWKPGFTKFAAICFPIRCSKITSSRKTEDRVLDICRRTFDKDASRDSLGQSLQSMRKGTPGAFHLIGHGAATLGLLRLPATPAYRPGLVR